MFPHNDKVDDHWPHPTTNTITMLVKAFAMRKVDDQVTCDYQHSVSVSVSVYSPTSSELSKPQRFLY